MDETTPLRRLRPRMLNDFRLLRTPREDWSSIPFYRELTITRERQTAWDIWQHQTMISTSGKVSPTLPLEILFDIIDYCDKRTLLNLRSVCHTLKNAVETNLVPTGELHLRPWRSLFSWDDVTKMLFGPARIPGFRIRPSDSMKPAITYEITFLDAYDLYRFRRSLDFVNQMWPVQPPRTEVAVRFDGAWRPPLRIADGIKCSDLISYAGQIAHKSWGDRKIPRLSRAKTGDKLKWIRFRFSTEVGNVVLPPPVRKIGRTRDH